MAADKVEMVTVNGVRYRPEDAPKNTRPAGEDDKSDPETKSRTPRNKARTAQNK